MLAKRTVFATCYRLLVFRMAETVWLDRIVALLYRLLLLAVWAVAEVVVVELCRLLSDLAFGLAVGIG